MVLLASLLHIRRAITFLAPKNYSSNVLEPSCGAPVRNLNACQRSAHTDELPIFQLCFPSPWLSMLGTYFQAHSLVLAVHVSLALQLFWYIILFVCLFSKIGTFLVMSS